jgi:hypothetical protein
VINEDNLTNARLVTSLIDQVRGIEDWCAPEEIALAASTTYASGPIEFDDLNNLGADAIELGSG